MGDEERTVLVIEDEVGLIELFDIWLSSEYTVETAADGASGLDALDDSVDLVILDWYLPDVSGADILAHIDELDLDPRVLVVTGVEPAIEGVGEGVDRVLAKPIDKADLLTAIESLIG